MFSKKTYLARIYAIAASLVLICEILARVLWIGGGPNNDQYYDLWATISSLYDPSYPAANPIGEYFFWASMIIVGLLIFAMIAYVHPRFMQGAKGWTILGTLFMLLGGFGFLLVGAIPQHTLDFISKRFHEISAEIGGGGVIIGAMFYGLASVRGKLTVNRKICWLIFMMYLTFIVLLLSSLYGAYIMGIDPHWGDSFSTPQNFSPYFAFAIWEKIGYWLMVSYLGLMGVLLPDNVENLKSH